MKEFIAPFIRKRKSIYYVENEKGCHVCTSHGRNQCGYPVISINHKKYLMNRYVWHLENGVIPDGYCVLHTCDNPACININHLWLGTPGDNARDRQFKNRQGDVKGEKNGRAKLTPEKVFQIKNSTDSPKLMSRKFGIGLSQIWSIRTGKSWTQINI